MTVKDVFIQYYNELGRARRPGVWCKGQRNRRPIPHYQIDGEEQAKDKQAVEGLFRGDDNINGALLGQDGSQSLLDWWRDQK
ncbi:hypothetical protein [Neorhizobium alkalisoli]|uniref:hypothetical protein n=1 Tax=Neorhizobium alkalisoli TaxID=528178 RepID=UPI000CF97AE5|nr:hypothetical protein [Neorhizobium alkalisoli]